MSRYSAARSPRIHSNLEDPSSGLKPYAMLLIALSILCFIGAFIQNLRAGKTETFTFDPQLVDQVETLEVTGRNAVYVFDVSQNPNGLPDNSGWSDVSINVRTQNGETILSFGSDFWRASGYDDGPWSEKKSEYSMKVVFPVPATYQLSIESSSSPSNYNQPVKLKATPQRGSTLPFLLLGVPALLGGIALGYWANREAVNQILSEMN